MARKSYDLAFKREALRLLKEHNRPLHEVATMLGVCRGTLYRWLRTYEPEIAKDRFDPTVGVSDPAEEAKILRAEVERLKMEMDVLKKALAILSRQQS